jgi:hypothetical protein
MTHWISGRAGSPNASAIHHRASERERTMRAASFGHQLDSEPISGTMPRMDPCAIQWMAYTCYPILI